MWVLQAIVYGGGCFIQTDSGKGYYNVDSFNLLITTIWANSHLSPSFSASTFSIPYPFYIPSLFIPASISFWESQESLSLLCCLVKVLRLV